MMNKRLGLLSSGILALVIFMSLVSAVTLAEWPLTASGTATTINANVNVSAFTAIGVGTLSFGTNGASADDWSLTTLNTSKYYQVTISPKTGYILTLSQIDFAYSSDVTTGGSFIFQYSKDSNFSLPTTIVTKTDVNTTEINSSNTGLNIQVNPGETIYIRWFGYGFTANTDNFNIKNLKIVGDAVRTFCKNGPINDTDLTLNVDITNNGEGEDNEWLPLDEIEIKVELENDKNIDLDNVIFELGLFKQGSSTNLIDDMIWISKDAEEVEVGDIDEGEDKSHVFQFKVDPAEIDSGDYLLMVKAHPEGDEDVTCIDYSDDLADFGVSEFSADIEVSKESEAEKMVIVDVDSLPLPLEALCGQQVSFTADIYNIGDRDFQDQIMVSLYNQELGIDLKEVVTGDFDEGDKTEVTFNFRVPSDAKEKTYTLYMKTYYDYDEDDDEYDETSDDTFPIQLKIEGACVYEPKLTIISSLESGGKAGEELVVKASVTNIDSSTRTFDVSATGYDTWAELVNINPETLTLSAGESKEVLFTLLVNRDVLGNKEFNMQLTTEDEKVISQPVSVLVEKAGFSLITGKITGKALGENWYLWGIGALNIILVLIIIMVAVRLVRKK